MSPEDIRKKFADGTITMDDIKKLCHSQDREAARIAFFASAAEIKISANDIDGNNVTGTVMQLDTGNQASPPAAKYTMIRILPTASVDYRGETHTAPFNLNADQGRFYPELTGGDAVTGNYDWIGWY